MLFLCVRSASLISGPGGGVHVPLSNITGSEGWGEGLGGGGVRVLSGLALRTCLEVDRSTIYLPGLRSR